MMDTYSIKLHGYLCSLYIKHFYFTKSA